MRNIALVFSAFIALFMLTGCPKDKVSVAGDADGDETEVVDQGQDSGGDGEEEEGGETRESQIKSGTGESGELLGSIYFDFDKFAIRTDMQSVIDEIANRALEGGEEDKEEDEDDEGEEEEERGDEPMRLVIEGNTDEFGTDEYNYALGTKRAIAVRDALVVKGVNKDNIRVVSFGESKPLCTEKTQDCYQKNRRSDVKESE